MRFLSLLLIPLLFLTPSAFAADTVVVSACTWFQLQCWFYPFLFFMVYMVMLLAVGIAGGVSGKGLTYIMMVGLAFSSAVEVMMNMMTIGFPLITTIMAVVYAWRFR